jgi:multidrug resistance efflux pump
MEAASKDVAALAARRRRAKNAYLILAASAAAVAALWFVHRWWTHGKEDTDDAQVEADVVPIAPRVGGLIKTARVQDNQMVKVGDVLFEIDPADLDVEVARCQAELDAARAQLRTAQAAVVQAEVDKRSAEIVLAREKTAEAAGVGSRAELATATQAVAKAVAAITVARATAGERAARVTQLTAHLAEMTLTAPIAGRVALIYPQDGARVEEGRPVIRLISGDVFVKFAIPADKVGSVKLGDTVDVKLDRRADLLVATVGHVAPELDAVAQMIIADADLVNPPTDLQPGTVGRILPRPPRPAGK